ncbi:MAG: amino acid adenylation domain-containing protein, partial [Acidobacteria bacterium]|nr:amino acid adenylation domain-containing protein [Acidobacteriota bacterium]
GAELDAAGLETLFAFDGEASRVVLRGRRSALLDAPVAGTTELAGATGAVVDPPVGPLEERLAALWSRLLGVPVVDRHADFFALGGHSLLATQAVSRIRDELAVAIDLEDLFRHPTPASLAVALAPRRASSAADAGGEPASTEPASTEPPAADAPGLEAGTPAVDAPGAPTELSFAQRRFWLLDRLSPGNPAYNIPAAVRLEGRLSVAALERALEQLVDRHPMLRTSFGEADGTPFQRVLASLPADRRPRLEIVALGGSGSGSLAPEALAREVERHITRHARRSFDIEALPLLRACLLRLGPADVDDSHHVLLLNLHHLVGDGWSMALIVRDLGELYSAAVEDREPRLPRLRLEYPEYARQRNAWLDGPEAQAERDYWRERLSGELPVLELPADHRPVRSRSGERPSASWAQTLPAPAAAALEALGREAGATPFMSLLALLAVLFRRLGGTDDLVIGTPIAGRRGRATEDVVGLFLNTLALRLDLSGELTFRRLLAQVREVARGAYAHQDLPFERILEDLAVDRDLGRTPVFQVLFNMLSYPLERLERPELRLEPLPPRDVGAKFDLTLYAHETEDADGARTYRLDWIYDRELFRPERVEHMARQVERLLTQVTAAPDGALAELDLRTAGGAAPLPDPSEPLAVPELPRVVAEVARWAQEQPGAAAICQGDDVWTYGELWRRVAAVAAALRGAGVAEGARVAVSGPPAPALIAALTAVLEAGAVLVPLDPGLTAERLDALLEIADVEMLVWTGGTEVPPGLSAVPRILALAPDGMPPATAPRIEATSASSSTEAYLFFTSGSTGRPKAILGNHRGLAHFLHWQRHTFDVGPGDRVAQLTALGFDPVLRDVFVPLVSGGAVVLPETADRVSGAGLWNWLERARVTRMQAVPSLLETWLEDVPPGIGLGALRTLFSMGEALTGELVERFRQHFPAVGQVVNLYGPTETTLAKCWYEVPRPAAAGVQPLGRTLPQTQALVLRYPAGGGRPVPCGIGEPGEIVLRTPFRSSGYVDAPEVDRARFVANPWRDDPEDLLFRTGDRGRYDLAGRLEFLGRADHQIKIRGVRIEPAEVRQALLALPGVAQGTVFTAYDETGSDGRRRPRLVAYAVPTPGTHLDPARLRALLARRLAPAAVPESFVILEELPRTHSGKIDVRRLPAPAPIETEGRFSAPTTLRQLRLAELWTELLGPGPYGLDDDFFARGGNSLKAVQLSARLATRHGVDLPLRAIFENPTLAAQAEAMAEGPADPTVDDPSIPRAEAENGEFPLSFAQLRLWFLDQLNPRLSAYNLPTAWRLRGELDARSLERALAAVVSRQGSLRTRFGAPGGRAVQMVDDAAAIGLPVEDLTATPPAEREDELARRLREEGETPFDLARSPLLRARLLRLGPQDHVLALTLHHIVADAWSVGLLLGELAEAYGADLDGRSAELPRLPVRYVDFAAWQQQRVAGEELASQIEYWRQRLADAPAALALPTDRPRPPVQQLRGARLAFRVAATQLPGLETLARELGATPFAVLLAVFATLLERTSGQHDFVVGTPVANRSRPELEPLVGLFLNTLGLRARDTARDSLRRATARLHALAVEAYENQDLPFEKLVDELEIPRDPSHSPIFQVLFTLHNTPLPRIRLENLELNPHPLPGHGAKFDLTLDLRATEDGLEGSLEYATALFDRATARRLVDRFARLLRHALEAPATPLLDLPMLAESERFQLLGGWNATAAPTPSLALPERLEEQARRRGEATAVLFHDERWSYSRLAREVRALTTKLTGHGVGPGDRVAVLLERSPRLIVALLATLRAGAAYVPLDPNYPAPRLAFMASDSGARLVLSEPALGGVVRLLPAIPVVWLGETDPADDSADAPPALDLDASAYVIYTSGSTGRPKGVEIYHRAMVNFLASMARVPGLEPADRVLAVTSPSFDIAVLELFLPIWVGAEVEICDAATAGDALALGKRLDGPRVTVAQATPSTWRMLAEIGWRPRPGLRVLTGGEALPEDLAQALGETQGELWNLYGPTETTVWSTVGQVVSGGPITLGRPIANTQVHVLDARLRPAGIGVPGEAYIGGAGVARGYVGRPGLTASRFLPNPFADQPGARLYRVGDLLRWLPDGRLVFLGRTDHQVKVRGFRIELGEIEAVLGRHPDLREAVVHTAGTRDRLRLVAYVVAEGGADGALSVESLRGWLGERLPAHLVPSLFLFLDALPRTASGKIDRRSLPAPEGERPDLEQPYVEPRTTEEARLAAIWSALLRVQQVGVLDNFFALGGDSILAVQMVFQAREAGLAVATAQVFQHQTLGELAAAARPLAAAPEAAPGDEGEGAAEDAEDDGFAAFGWSDEEGDAILEKL